MLILQAILAPKSLQKRKNVQLFKFSVWTLQFRETKFFHIFAHENMKNPHSKIGYIRKIVEFSVMPKTTQSAKKLKDPRII